jgi:ribose-phosphate pyrophosphokinase
MVHDSPIIADLILEYSIITPFSIVELLILVPGRSVIIIDDIIDTAGTICAAAEVMIEKGAKEVFGCCTHPVFSGPAVERLSKAPFKEVVITNTIPLPEEKKFPNLTVLSVAPLIGEAILRIHEDLSVSKLFEV